MFNESFAPANGEPAWSGAMDWSPRGSCPAATSRRGRGQRSSSVVRPGMTFAPHDPASVQLSLQINPAGTRITYMAKRKDDARTTSSKPDAAVAAGKGGETHQTAERRYAGTDHAAGHPGRRRPELAQGRCPRPDAAGRLPLPREDLPLRPRAHPRAGRPRPRLRRTRLLRELRAARRRHPRRPVPAQGREDARLRPLLDRRRQQGLGRPRPRRPRLRREVLHQAGQLGPRRQQHPGLLHPGRDQVPRPDPRRQARAGPRLPAGADRPRQLLGLHLAHARDACT